MLGKRICDEHGTEDRGEIRGMELLPVETYFEEEKTRTRMEGHTEKLHGELEALSGKRVSGYEIHMGKTVLDENACSLQTIGEIGRTGNGRADGCYQGSVLGTYLHGIFDEEEFRSAFVQLLCRRKGISYQRGETVTYEEYRQEQFDRLAEGLRKSLDMQEIYRMLG